jgi:hypothetical protein
MLLPYAAADESFLRCVASPDVSSAYNPRCSKNAGLTAKLRL